MESAPLQISPSAYPPMERPRWGPQGPAIHACEGQVWAREFVILCWPCLKNTNDKLCYTTAFFSWMKFRLPNYFFSPFLLFFFNSAQHSVHMEHFNFQAKLNSTYIFTRTHSLFQQIYTCLFVYLFWLLAGICYLAHLSNLSSSNWTAFKVDQTVTYSAFI